MYMQLTVVVGVDWTLHQCGSRSKAIANEYRHESKSLGLCLGWKGQLICCVTREGGREGRREGRGRGGEG